MSKQVEGNKETINQFSTVFEPWIKASKVWIVESEKLHQTAMANMDKALDSSHKLAKDSLDQMANISAEVRRQITTRVERSIELFSTLSH